MIVDTHAHLADPVFEHDLEAVPEGAEREALFEHLVAKQYAAGQAMNMAATCFRMTVEECLAAEGYSIAAVSNGAEALAGSKPRRPCCPCGRRGSHRATSCAA